MKRFSLSYHKCGQKYPEKPNKDDEADNQRDKHVLVVAFFKVLSLFTTKGKDPFSPDTRQSTCFNILTVPE